jgi:chemotaxis protein methyltransferase CheR
MMLRARSQPETVTALLERRTGQRISAARAWRIDAAMRPLLRELELATVDDVMLRIARGDEPLATRVIEALLNNETSFFRDFAMFDLLDKQILPGLAETRRDLRRLRIWSAGCATGQEAYSLAMLLCDGGRRWDGWTIDILATDISTSAVARARSGRYTQFEIQRGLPVRTMLTCFQQEGEDWLIDSALKPMVRFGAHNLLDAAPGRFDLILCRNVLMYFQPATRALVFDRLASALLPGGLLMLGAGETVIGQTDRFMVHGQWRGLYATAARPARAATHRAA